MKSILSLAAILAATSLTFGQAKKTEHTITLDDSDSTLGITVDDGKGGKIHIDTKSKKMTLEAPEGIEIKSKKITINGSDLVSIVGKAIKIG